MPRVAGVSAASTSAGSRFSVSGSMSTNTGVAPRSAKAAAVETKVNEGTITSSPGPNPPRRAAASSAAVQEWVSRARSAPVVSASQRSQRALNEPPAESQPSATACSM